ncbi:hypothetical protein EJ06DRAFT_507835 [Trichodelitschia bisporula]|uniref:PCI domain-containing protein n=1 Tax=Trichodelitschia bisporula TaxID=703511 RepID=A0A6G1I0U7_9PEZI|nr:hypothetical protein EJ06DRAFT_507835 [Trichodelitschia bisporula]
MEQQRALSALEPYLILSKNATTPRAAADLITQATSAPHVYVFAELLRTPTVQALRDSAGEWAVYYRVLELFAWGTWREYHDTPALPPLTEPQAHKLRLLTLLTLLSQPGSSTYPSLTTALRLADTRELEALLTSSIYAGLMSASLDAQGQRVIVHSLAPLRDLRPGALPQLREALKAWWDVCAGVIQDLETEGETVRQRAVEKGMRSARVEGLVGVRAGEGPMQGMEWEGEGRRGRRGLRVRAWA